MAPSLVTQIVGGVVRLALTSVFTWMIQNGIISDGDVEAIVAGIAGLAIVAGWTVYQKLAAWDWLHRALGMPAGSSVDDLAEVRKNNPKE